MDNTRPHSANMTNTVLEDLGIDVLAHPTYFPDLASSDYYLLCVLSNILRGRSFYDNGTLNSLLADLFAQTPVKGSRSSLMNDERQSCRMMGTILPVSVME